MSEKQNSNHKNTTVEFYPLFDTLEYLTQPIPAALQNFIKRLNNDDIAHEYELCVQFLKSYAGSQDTYNAYRREVERLLHWCWQVKKMSLKKFSRHDFREYLDFIQSPPLAWISTKNVSRFVAHEGQRIPNKEWRPFVVRASKSQSMHGISLKKQDHQLSPKSLQALMATLSTFFNYFIQEEYLNANPVQMVRQKNRIIQRVQTRKITRKLSHTQWLCVIDIAKKLADQNQQYERSLFMLSAFYLLGLRISELAETKGRVPKMSDFAPDKEGRWWFTTIGKGNKIRDVAIPDEMLSALKRYRTYLQLTPLPNRTEQTPLLHKQRGQSGLGTRQIRKLIQECFNAAIDALRQQSLTDEAEDLMAATVHWLRHTAISNDVEFRPREHVRDDAGHGSATTTDLYIDIDRRARHDSAKSKTLKPHQSNLPKETIPTD